MHAAHGFKLPALLAIKQLAPFAQHGQGGDTLAEWNLVLGGNVLILIHVPDVDMDQYIVGFEKGQVLRVVEVDVKHLAVAAPFAAEVEDDSLVSLGGPLQSGSEIGLGLRGIGINVPAGRMRRGDAESEEKDEGNKLEGLQWGASGVSSVP